MAFFSDTPEYGEMTILRDNNYIGAHVNGTDAPVPNGTLMTIDINADNDLGPVVLGGPMPTGDYVFVCVENTAVEGSKNAEDDETEHKVNVIANHIYVKKLGEEPLFFIENNRDYNDSWPYDTKSYNVEPNRQMRAHKLNLGEMFVINLRTALPTNTELGLSDLPFRGK